MAPSPFVYAISAALAIVFKVFVINVVVEYVRLNRILGWVMLPGLFNP